jgi:hypothetical protein
MFQVHRTPLLYASCMRAPRFMRRVNREFTNRLVAPVAAREPAWIPSARSCGTARRTFATLAPGAGRNLHFVAEQVGQANPELTLRVDAHAGP